MEKAKVQQPDVIFMDLGLPGMGGMAAMKKLSAMKETKNIPVIALTAAANPEDVELYYSSRASAVRRALRSRTFSRCATLWQ